LIGEMCNDSDALNRSPDVANKCSKIPLPVRPAIRRIGWNVRHYQRLSFVRGFLATARRYDYL
jgi:hypothetical protein